MQVCKCVKAQSDRYGHTETLDTFQKSVQCIPSQAVSCRQHNEAIKV